MRFEDFRYGLLKPVIATFYHWSEPADRDHLDQLTKDMIVEGQLFYVSDDIHSWASPWVEGMKLYAVDVHVRRPMPLFEQMMPRELMDTEFNEELVAQCQYDSVIYTPHPLGRGVREMCLFYPKIQIHSIVEVKDVDIGQIRKEQDLMGSNYKVLRGWERPAVKAIPPWEDIPVVDLTSEEPLVEMKNDAFHIFMENLHQAVKNVIALDESKADPLSPETWELVAKDMKRAKQSKSDPVAMCERAMLGEHLREQERHNAFHTEEERDRASEAEVSLDSLARQEREITISMLPPEFRDQQKRAAARDKTTLNADEMIINQWVFTWEDGIGEILDALKSDPEAKAAMAGVCLEAIDIIKQEKNARAQTQAAERILAGEKGYTEVSQEEYDQRVRTLRDHVNEQRK